MRRARKVPPDKIAGLTVGLLDISKPRGNIFLDRIEERLTERGVAVKRYEIDFDRIPAALLDAEGHPILAAFEYQATHDVVIVNGVGEGMVNVCGEGGDIAIGDLIVTSSMQGKGMRQPDGIVRNTTVAKSREAVAFSSQTEVKQIACIYLCG